METLELEGWMATYDVRDIPEVTIPSTPITSEDFVLSACTQASTGFKMITSMPFKFDSGASCYDFTKLNGLEQSMSKVYYKLSTKVG